MAVQPAVCYSRVYGRRDDTAGYATLAKAWLGDKVLGECDRCNRHE